MMLPKTLIHIITYNSADYIITCLSSTLKQRDFVLGENLHVWISDNASNDNSVTLTSKHLKDFPTCTRLIEHNCNLGFSKAHNLALSEAISLGFEYILILNPDLFLADDALGELVSALASDPSAGICCPVLFRATKNLEESVPRAFDSTGMYITPTCRHFDRGSNIIDTGQYQRPEYVFGSSGAAMCIRATCVKDISWQHPGQNYYEFFADSFFAYREDADVSWRAQWLGWKCRFQPTAIGWHRRLVLPERRKSLRPELNCLSVTNRFLLQLHNFSFLANFHCIVPTVFRNLLVLGAIFTIEQSSLPALKKLLDEVRHAYKRRIWLFKHRRVSNLCIRRWFSNKPLALPALEPKSSKFSINRVLIIIINYNSGQRLASCLQTLTQSLTHSTLKRQLTIAVVDNDSTDKSSIIAKKAVGECAEVTFYDEALNLGFAGAINRSASRVDSDAILILNPDIEIDYNSVDHLCSILEQFDHMGAISPLLTSPTEQGSKIQKGFVARRFRTLSASLAELFGLHRFWPNNPWTSHLKYLDDPLTISYLLKDETKSNTNSEPQQNLDLPLVVEQPAGACLLTKRKCFEELRGFDENFWPAWFEDVDFCKRMAESNWYSAVTNKVSAVHEGGYSYRHLGDIRFAKIWYPNLLKYHKKHNSTVAYAIVKLCSSFALVLRSILFSFQGILSAETTKRDSKFKQANAYFRLALNPSASPPYDPV